MGSWRARATARPRTSLVVLILAVWVARARGADEPERQALDEVVVTAPPLEDAAGRRDPTAFATVVDTRAAPTAVTTLADALTEAPGVQVRRFGGLGDFSTVSIRGSSAGQVQVYLDGVPLSRAENEVVNLSDLPLDAVERVEVYRSATPLGFAQAGPGGVVNVVTRRPGATALTAGSASYGSFETRKANLVHSARAGAWESLAFAHYLGSKGDFEFTDDLGTTANPADDRTERRANNAFDLGDLVARVGYRPGGALAAMFTSDTFVKHEGVPGVGSVQALDTSLRTLRQLGHAELNLAPSGPLAIEGEAQVFTRYERVIFDDPEGEISLVPTDVETDDVAVGAQALVRAALGAHHVPGVFAAVGHEGFAECDALDPAPAPPDKTRLRGTLAAENEILLFAERVSVVPGVRWEVFRDDFPGDPQVPLLFGAGGVRVSDFTSPRLGLRAELLPGLALLGNVGRFAREPNLSELFGDRGVIVGNPTLEAETAFNRDVGARWRLPAFGPVSHATLEYAYFDNDVDDLIILVQNSQRVVRPENVTSATVRGHEVAAQARFGDHVGLSANYTHQDARDDGDVTFLRGKQLPGRPANEFFSRLEVDRSPWRLFATVNLVADNYLDRANVRRVDSRRLYDAGLAVELPHAFGVTFEARNLSDDQTRDVLGFPVPGRSFYVTLAYGFGQGGDLDGARP